MFSPDGKLVIALSIDDWALIAICIANASVGRSELRRVCEDVRRQIDKATRTKPEEPQPEIDDLLLYTMESESNGTH